MALSKIFNLSDSWFFRLYNKDYDAFSPVKWKPHAQSPPARSLTWQPLSHSWGCPSRRLSLVSSTLLKLYPLLIMFPFFFSNSYTVFLLFLLFWLVLQYSLNRRYTWRDVALFFFIPVPSICYSCSLCACVCVCAALLKLMDGCVGSPLLHVGFLVAAELGHPDCRLLTAVAFLLGSIGSSVHRFSSCGSRGLSCCSAACGIPPEPGIKPVSLH